MAQLDLAARIGAHNINTLLRMACASSPTTPSINLGGVKQRDESCRQQRIVPKHVANQPSLAGLSGRTTLSTITFVRPADEIIGSRDRTPDFGRCFSSAPFCAHHSPHPVQDDNLPHIPYSLYLGADPTDYPLFFKTSTFRGQ